MYNPARWHVGRWIALGFLTLFGVFVATMVYVMLAVATRAGPGTYYPLFPWGFGFFGFFLVVFLFFGLLRWALWPWRGGYRRYGYYGHGDPAYHVLRERFARGEITKDQYDQMMRDLYPRPRYGP